MRDGYAAWGDEVGWLPKASQPYVRAKVVSEIGSISQIKHLENRLKISPLPYLEVLGYARIELEEGLTSDVVERSKGALTGSQTVPVQNSVCV